MAGFYRCPECLEVLEMDEDGHYDPKTRTWKCLLDHDGKSYVQYDEHGNEKI